MKKDPRVYLAHMRDAIEKIIAYAGTDREAFLADTKSQDALIRQYEILGEAAKRVDEPTRGRYPDIPWKPMAGLRDRAIHDYSGVNVPFLWELTVKEMPRLQKRFKEILKEVGEPGI